MFLVMHDYKYLKYVFPPFYMWMTFFYLYALNEILQNQENENFMSKLEKIVFKTKKLDLSGSPTNSDSESESLNENEEQENEYQDNQDLEENEDQYLNENEDQENEDQENEEQDSLPRK